MTKGLEAYKKFCDDVNASVNSGGIHYIDIRNKEIIEKELKALEIIKNKWVNIEVLIQSKTLDDYNTTLCVHDLTQEEFDLLKEVLL